MPPTPSPVPLLLSWGAVQPFRPKYIYPWEFICASKQCLCGIFSCSEIAPKVDLDLWRSMIFSEALAELFGICYGIHGKMAMVLKCNHICNLDYDKFPIIDR